MSSSSIQCEIKTVAIVDAIETASDSRSSSNTSHSNPTVIEKTSSDVFELARENLSTSYLLEHDLADEFNVTELNTGFCGAKIVQSTPQTCKICNKKKSKGMGNTKMGSCNCKSNIQNYLANRLLKLKTTSTPKFKTQTNDLDNKYNINVPEISVKYSSSGIIKIPIEVRLCLKQSGDDTSVKQENLPEDTTLDSEESIPGYVKWSSLNCLFQDCSAWEYMETYLDELLDEPLGTHSKFKNYLVFDGECTDHYAELYHQEGYRYSEDEFIVPEEVAHEDLIPIEYRSRLNAPFPDDDDDDDEDDNGEVLEKELSVEVDHDSRIHWEDVCLPPKETVEIAPTPLEPEEPVPPHSIPVPEGYKPPPPRRPVAEEEKKKKKSGGFFGCCGGEDDDDEEDMPPPRKQTSIVFKPVPKTSLIYGQHCLENEPYTRRLLKAYPHYEKSDSPCSSKTEIPWPKILLPEVVKIRSVDIIDFTGVKTEPSTSTNAVCLCASYKDKSDVKPDIKKLSKPKKILWKKSVSSNDLCLCASNEEELNNLDLDILGLKSDIKNLSEPNTTSSKNTVTFRNNKLVTLYPPPNLPVVQSKSNTFSTKEPVGMIKTKLSGKSKSDEGIMRTKVTLSGKDLNRLLESQGKIRSSNIIQSSGCPKLASKQICPPTSQVKVSSSHSAPCVPETCSERIKVESSHIIKADPVISALIACEAELKPVKQALNTVQQKLRNMNMPELDSIFSKGTELANVFLNKAQQNRCNCATSRYASGYNPNTAMKPANVKFMNNRMTTYARPMSSYPASYTNPSPSTTYMPQRPRPYVEQCQFGPAPYYGQYQSSSLSQSSSCAPSVQNFSMRPNYDRNDLYPDERVPSKSAFRRPGNSNKQHVKYRRDQSEDWRSTDRPERNCCCTSSTYSSHNGLQIRRSDDEMTFTSSSSPSEDSMPRKRRSRSRHRRLIPKVKSKNSGIVSRQSLCPFLEAMKSIMILDNKKTVKRGINGVSYDTKLSTKKIKNMRMHMRVRTSKVSKK